MRLRSVLGLAFVALIVLVGLVCLVRLSASHAGRCGAKDASVAHSHESPAVPHEAAGGGSG